MLSSAANNYWLTWFPGAMLAMLGVIALSWKGVVWLVTSTRTLKQVQVALPAIQSEFSPNHGTSMKDRIEVLHDGQVRVLRRLDAQDRRLNQHEAALDRIEDKLR